jgi:SAM-dependent methyltransferase
MGARLLAQERRLCKGSNMNAVPNWSGNTGDIWAERWRDTDRGLRQIGEALNRAIERAAPDGAFRALDVGCGPGSTSLALAAARPDAAIVACDISPALVELARGRAAEAVNLEFRVGDAESVAAAEGPFDLVFSRHGVMFFDDPYRAFASLRQAARPGGRLVFSCFQAWELNSWATELAEAAAGGPVAPPGREPSGFAFADPVYVENILSAAGWSGVERDAVSFSYVTGEGAKQVDQALAFLTRIGPASNIVRALAPNEQEAAIARIREVLERRCSGGTVEFPAAAWIWSAVRAG